jgi:enolase-phosphatase E1
VLAQRLLFGTTATGDLTQFIGRFFDTLVGTKQSPHSYQRIAVAMGHPCRELLFISDVIAEVEAAHAAGMQAALCVRPGNDARESADAEVIRSFDEIAA